MWQFRRKLIHCLNRLIGIGGGRIHYGVEDWEVTLSSSDIWVDVPKREFTFKNAQFNFELLLGSSNSEDGAKMNFSKVADGSGTFDFSEGSKNVQILELNLNFDLSLFNEE